MLICLAGQSNALGWGTIGQPWPYPGGWEANPNIKIWTPARRFEQYIPGVNAGGLGSGETNPTAFGMEGRLAQCFAPMCPGEDILILKQAAIGVGLTLSAVDSWSPLQRNKQFDALCHNLERAQDEARSSIDTFVYQGCETDALTAAQADRVLRELSVFFAAIRGRTNSPKMLAVVPQIHERIPTVHPAYVATGTVTWSQRYYGANWPRTCSFPTGDLSTNADLHLNNVGVCEVGEYAFFWSSKLR